MKSLYSASASSWESSFSELVRRIELEMGMLCDLNVAVVGNEWHSTKRSVFLVVGVLSDASLSELLLSLVEDWLSMEDESVILMYQIRTNLWSIGWSRFFSRTLLAWMMPTFILEGYSGTCRRVVCGEVRKEPLSHVGVWFSSSTMNFPQSSHKLLGILSCRILFSNLNNADWLQTMKNENNNCPDFQYSSISRPS